MMATYRAGDPGYPAAAERWRLQWRVQTKEAISYDQAHGAGAAWGTPPEPADPALALAAVADLAEQERWAEAVAYGRLVDDALPDLVAWGIANRPDIHAAPVLSEAERRRRALSDLDVIAGRHR